MPDDLTTWTGGSWSGDEAAPVNGFTQDSRTIEGGEMFVALKTASRDGHDFVNAAGKAGAAAALVDHKVNAGLPQLVVPNTLEGFQAIAARHRRTFEGRVIGITGSNGKTSTKDLLSLLLGQGTLKTQANLNNFLGVPLTLTRLDSKQHAFAVVEAGINEPGEMVTLEQMIAPDIAIITSVGLAHIEKLGSIHGVAEEKAKMGAHAPVVLFPGDCWQYQPFQAIGGRAMVVSDDPALLASLPEKQSVASRIGNVGVESCRLHLESAALPAGTYELPFNSPGMVSNAALAITAAQLCGVNPDLVQDRLKHWRPSRNRGEWRTLGRQQFYVDCYNANPTSMTEAFRAFAQGGGAAQPRLYVLGGMKELGVQSYELHKAIGKSLPLRPQDSAVLIGNEAEGYADGLLEAGHDAQQLSRFASAEEATATVQSFQGAILLKGSRAYALETLLHASISQEGAC